MQKAITPPELVAPSMAKIIVAMTMVVGTATVRLPKRSAAKPTVMRATKAAPLRIAACGRARRVSDEWTDSPARFMWFLSCAQVPVHCLLARLDEAETREGRRRREGRTHAVTHDRLACVVLLGEHLNVEDLLE